MSDSRDPDFLPTASLHVLQRRAELLRVVRRFFDERGYCEVETPILSRDVVVDAHLEPFCTVDGDGAELFLQTSPEFAMKRLLAAGATAIYQLARAFRREETGRLHNPEFTLLEWYRVGDTHREQMEFTEELVRHVFEHIRRPGLESQEWDRTPFMRLAYDDAFERYLGTRVLHLSGGELRELAVARGIRFPAGLTDDDRDEWLNLLLAECVEPGLRAAGAVFLYDYPASQAALAVIRDELPPVAERFELYVAGIELCNGYHELTDPDELRRRIAGQAAIRARNNRRPLPAESRLLDAMRHGLPPCAGVALGVDRLALLALGGRSLGDVTAFPADRA
jgi:elongation factor P--(R)-beta-lysine ligase